MTNRLTFANQAGERSPSSFVIRIGIVICMGVVFNLARSQASKKDYVVVDENANRTNISIRLTEVLLIDLPEKSSTGYGWRLVKVDRELLNSGRLGSEEIERFRKNGILPEHPVPKFRFGGTEWEVFRIKPRGVGVTEIELDYARPWQPDKPANIFLLNVTTKK